jgi:preprotein translocase subunit SecD
MLRFPTWKIVVVLGICLAGVAFSLPNLFPRAEMARMPDWLPHQQINLGLDLQGGSHLLLEVNLEAVIDERLNSLLDDVRATLRPERIGYRGLGIHGDAVSFVLTDPASAPRAVELLDDLNTNPVTRELEVTDAGNGRIEIHLSESAADDLRSTAVQQSLEIVRRRIDEVGTREPTIQQQGTDRILVQVPGEKDPDAIKRLLGQTAKLTFHLVDLDTPLDQALSGNLPPGSMILPSEETSRPGEMAQQVVRKRVEVSGESLVDAQPTYQENQPVVSFRFDSIGARKFGDVTRDHVGELLAIVLDNKVISSPRIREPILGGSGIISGNFTVDSANELAVLLRAGALPAPLDIVEERTVGPDL